jgi:hypothetical protein
LRPGTLLAVRENKRLDFLFARRDSAKNELKEKEYQERLKVLMNNEPTRWPQSKIQFLYTT